MMEIIEKRHPGISDDTKTAVADLLKQRRMMILEAKADATLVSNTAKSIVLRRISPLI